MKERDMYDYLMHLENTEIPTIKEELSPYLACKAQGEFTTTDYYNLPDNQRAELIDGIIYDMSSPSIVHQMIGDLINFSFYQYIHKKKGQCVSATSPFDIQLDCDDRTVLQPDVFIVCDKSKFKKNVLYGAPDLVVEILSPSTRTKDINIKTQKYRNAGVQEYWIIDPMCKQVRVYKFKEDTSIALYTFENNVPVGIWNGECVVDFKEINEYISFLGE